MIADLVGITMIAMTLVIAGLVARDDTRRKHDLVNTRNIFLCGFVLFQVTSVCFTVFSDWYAPYFLLNKTGTLLLYTFLTVAFFVVFWMTYARGWMLNWMLRLRRYAPPPPQTEKLLLLSFLMTGAAIVMRFGVNVPLVGILASYTGSGVAAAACGIIGWVWIRQPLNPALAFYGLAVIGANLAVTVYGTSSRRFLLSIFICIVWAAYFSKLRYFPKRRYLPTLIALSAVGVVVVALFTSVRDAGDRTRTVAGHIQAMVAEGSITRGLMQIGPGQQTGGVSLWLIEQYPDQYEYRGPFTLTYIVLNAVPRAIWEDKPDTLSQEIPHMARLKNVSRDKLTIGPGIIGQSWSDFGVAAVLLYAFFFALIFRFIDNVIRIRIHDPVVIIPLGAALGQAFAIPRGDVSLFAFTYLYTSFTTVLVFAGLAYVSRYRRRGSQVDAEPEHATPDESGSAWSQGWDSDQIDRRPSRSETDSLAPRPALMPNYAET